MTILSSPCNADMSMVNFNSQHHMHHLWSRCVSNTCMCLERIVYKQMSSGLTLTLQYRLAHCMLFVRCCRWTMHHSGSSALKLLGQLSHSVLSSQMYGKRKALRAQAVRATHSMRHCMKRRTFAKGWHRSLMTGCRTLLCSDKARLLHIR